MRRSFRLGAHGFAWLACIGITAAAATRAAAAGTTSLPKGTPIVVATYNTINSATFHPGERLAFTVSDDVIVNGALVAKAGDMASGIVEDAVQGRKVRAGSAGMLLGPVGAVAGGVANRVASKGANLRVSVDRLRTFCGSTIDLSFVRSEYHKPKRFHKMTAVEVAKGQKYVTTVAGDTTVCSEPTTRTPAPIPSDALRADGA